MIVTKGLHPIKLVLWTWHHVLWLSAFCGGVAALYHFKILDAHLPWLPVSTVGTAVAFYLGFKNNSAYDRMWEARKIWGGIVNTSRMWGMNIKDMVTNEHTNQEYSSDELEKHIKSFVFRHIGWLTAL